jgi:hypothetical protein
MNVYAGVFITGCREIIMHIGGTVIMQTSSAVIKEGG